MKNLVIMNIIISKTGNEETAEQIAAQNLLFELNNNNEYNLNFINSLNKKSNKKLRTLCAQKNLPQPQYTTRAFFLNRTPSAVQNSFDLEKSCLGTNCSKFCLVYMNRWSILEIQYGRINLASRFRKNIDEQIIFKRKIIPVKTKKTPLSNQYTTRGTAFRL